MRSLLFGVVLNSVSRLLLSTGNCVVIEFGDSPFSGIVLIPGSRRRRSTGVCFTIEFGDSVSLIGKCVNLWGETAP